MRSRRQHQIRHPQRTRRTPHAPRLIAAAAPASPAVKSPGGMESPRGAARLQLPGTAGLRYTAAGLPPGLAISPAGLISAAGRRRGTSTVTVTGRTAAGATTTVTFVWTVS